MRLSCPRVNAPWSSLIALRAGPTYRHSTPLAGLPLYRALGFEPAEEVMIDSDGLPIPCVHMVKGVG